MERRCSPARHPRGRLVYHDEYVLFYFFDDCTGLQPLPSSRTRFTSSLRCGASAALTRGYRNHSSGVRSPGRVGRPCGGPARHLCSSRERGALQKLRLHSASRCDARARATPASLRGMPCIPCNGDAGDQIAAFINAVIHAVGDDLPAERWIGRCGPGSEVGSIRAPSGNL